MNEAIWLDQNIDTSTKIVTFLLAHLTAGAIMWCPPVFATPILSTDFTGRTVSGKTAGNIPWTLDGVQDPGDLSWVQESGVPAGTALFDTANAQGHFAPDMNIGNEGPWSTTVALALTVPQVTLQDVLLDWQHFSNAGGFQGPARSADWTVSVTGSTSGLLGSITASGISGTSGIETLTFVSPLALSNAETYEVKIFVTSSATIGNNTGLDALTLNGTVIPEPGVPSLLFVGVISLALLRRAALFGRLRT